MCPIDYDKSQFLEPAHSHDLDHISRVIALPISFTEHLQNPFQGDLAMLLKSTSVAFASPKRLQDLVSNCFQRVVPTKSGPMLSSDQ